MITFEVIKKNTKLFYLLVPGVIFIMFSLFTKLDTYGKDFFWPHLVVFFPALFSIGINWGNRIVIYLNMVIGYTICVTIVAYIVWESNLWPFSLGFAPLYSIPPLVIYSVIVEILTRCISLFPMRKASKQNDLDANMS